MAPDSMGPRWLRVPSAGADPVRWGEGTRTLFEGAGKEVIEVIKGSGIFYLRLVETDSVAPHKCLDEQRFEPRGMLQEGKPADGP